MSIAAQSPTRSRTPAGRRLGYLVGAVVNLAMLAVANNVLAWGWFPWLTNAFEDVLPLLSLSLVVATVWNLAWVVYDAGWFKSVGNIMQSALSLAVTARFLQVFPFDFSVYDFNWEAVVRGLLILALVGVSIAIVVELVKLIGRARRL